MNAITINRPFCLSTVAEREIQTHTHRHTRKCRLRQSKWQFPPIQRVIKRFLQYLRNSSNSDTDTSSLFYSSLFVTVWLADKKNLPLKSHTLRPKLFTCYIHLRKKPKYIRWSFARRIRKRTKIIKIRNEIKMKTKNRMRLNRECPIELNTNFVPMGYMAYITFIIVDTDKNWWWDDEKGREHAFDAKAIKCCQRPCPKGSWKRLTGYRVDSGCLTAHILPLCVRVTIFVYVCMRACEC